MSLITTPPALQNFAETSIGIVFGVSHLANGFVTYGREPDLRDGITVVSGGYRLTDLDDAVVRVRLTNLQPATTYYYRIHADRLDYRSGYDMRILGHEADPKIYSFMTAGASAHSHFCVMNDTHSCWKTFTPIIQKVKELQPACLVWNGDALNGNESIEQLTQAFLCPPIAFGFRDYASTIPLLFCPGNHEHRGLLSRHLERFWMFRQPEERSSRDWDLGRNFAVRLGDIALVGLDTAEDKLDSNPLFANTFRSEPYREAQTLWLADALARPKIASAPYLVALCHIPLFDSNPRSNPGDIAPADTSPDYDTDYAHWQRTCATLWGSLLAKAGCQLVITGHQHVYRYDPPTPDRPWAQLVGGGPEDASCVPERFPTVFEGLVENNHLLLRVHNTHTDLIQDEFRFPPR